MRDSFRIHFFGFHQAIGSIHSAPEGHEPDNQWKEGGKCLPALKPPARSGIYLVAALV
jgi:hypothetical protein